MINEFQVVFHNIDQTQAIVGAVQKRLHKLTRCDQIMKVGLLIHLTIITIKERYIQLE